MRFAIVIVFVLVSVTSSACLVVVEQVPQNHKTLINTIKKRDTATFNLLLSSGLDPNISIDFGYARGKTRSRSLLEYTVSRGTDEMVYALLLNGANFDDPEASVYMLSARSLPLSLSYLLSMNPQLGSKSRYRQQAISEAVQYRKTEVLMIWVDYMDNEKETDNRWLYEIFLYYEKKRDQDMMAFVATKIKPVSTDLVERLIARGGATDIVEILIKNTEAALVPAKRDWSNAVRLTIDRLIKSDQDEDAIVLFDLLVEAGFKPCKGIATIADSNNKHQRWLHTLAPQCHWGVQAHASSGKED